MATKPQNLSREMILSAYKATLHLSRALYKSTLFMQNKANLLAPQMNVSVFSKMAYENKSNWTLGENKPNQTQSLVKDLIALVMFISKTVKILVLRMTSTWSSTFYKILEHPANVCYRHIGRQFGGQLPVLQQQERIFVSVFAGKQPPAA